MSHMTIAASSNAFVQLFNTIRDNFTFSKSDFGTFGPFSASYSVALHLEDGNIQLNNDDTVEVKHLKIVWSGASFSTRCSSTSIRSTYPRPSRISLKISSGTPSRTCSRCFPDSS